MTDEAAVAAAFAEARRAFGPVAILVNNAGAAESAPFVRTSLELFRRMLDVNLIGTFLCSRAALPDMLEAGFGRIVNVASVAGLKGAAYVSAYCAAKHGVVGLTRALALETASKGITVNAVCPSYTDTEMARARDRQHRAQDRAQRRRGRGGAGEEEPAGAADPPRGGGGERALAVRAGHRGDHRPGDRDRGRRGDVMAFARALDRPEPESKRRLRLWLRLYAATSVIEREMRRFLRARFATTLPRFDLMAALERAPDGLTMGELSRRLMVSGGNVTSIVAGLERDGLVRRRSPASDRRTSYVALTAPGRSAFAAMARAHERWIDQLLAEVPDDEVETLTDRLAELKHRSEKAAAERMR